MAEELGADLMVVGSCGLGTVKRLVVGRVSEGIVGLAPCPVLVRWGGKGAWPPSRVIVGGDSSIEAKRASELAASIGWLFGAPVLLVGAFLSEYKHISMAANRQRARDEARRAEESLEAWASESEDTLGKYPQGFKRRRVPGGRPIGDGRGGRKANARSGRQPELRSRETLSSGRRLHRCTEVRRRTGLDRLVYKAEAR
ncbi:MAG: universal stress protein [Actinomycetota bacterium]|nr:universal stress protein [Actinomycetota bacterium]